MATPPIERLHRYLDMLRLLEGTPLRCKEGLFLFVIEGVQQPALLVESCQQTGWPALAAVQEALRVRGSVRPFGIQQLAACQRELRTLQQDKEARATYHDAKWLRRFPEPTQVWIEKIQTRIDTFGGWLETDARATTPVVWFEGALSVIEAVRGSQTRAWVSASLHGSCEEGQARRQQAKKRLQLVLTVLQTHTLPETLSADDPLVDFVYDLGRGRLRNARALQQRLAQTLSHPLSWHQPVAWGRVDPTQPKDVQVRMWGEAWIRSLPSTKNPSYINELQRTFALYGLVCTHAPHAEPLILHASDIQNLLSHSAFLPTLLAKHALSWEQVLRLCKLPLKRHHWDKWIPWIAQGFDLRLVEQLYECKQAHSVLHYEWPHPTALQAYSRWLIQLTPLLHQLGLKGYLAPEVFQRWNQTKRQDTLLLLHWLTQGEINKNLPTLVDATLGLMRQAPSDTQRLLATLMTIPKGIGEQRAPTFCAWLQNDALLDEYLHLCTLVDEPHPLSNTLLRDFARLAQLQKEQEHLSRLQSPTAQQTQRLARVTRMINHGELPGPNWTIRRLRERIEVLKPKAYQRQLDLLLLRLCRSTLHIPVRTVTPAWRDALRFYLCVDDNHVGLQTLLQFAAQHPKRHLPPTLPLNQAWLHKAQLHMNTSAWLQPRKQSLLIQGESYELSAEHDPLEVLRMGIPFNTCLSLNEGMNAASTVINALDVNKLVLYVRNATGSVVARQLIAVSKDGCLVGYRVYMAVDESRAGPMRAAFLSLCQQLARETGLPLADEGVPEQIHPGFWYDDGPEPFAVQALSSAVQVYCAHLHLPLPAEIPEELQREAHAFAQRQPGNVLALLPTLSARTAPAQQAQNQWVLTQLSEAAAWKHARTSPTLFGAWAQRLLPNQAVTLFQQARKHQVEDIESHAEWWDLLLPSYEVAEALLAWVRSIRQWNKQDDHGLAHQALSAVPYHLQRAPLACFFTVCDALETLWQRLLVRNEDCRSCYDDQRTQLQTMALQRYRVQPDPEGLVFALRHRRHGLLAHQIALHVAARSSLPARGQAPVPWSPLHEVQPVHGESLVAWHALQALPVLKPQLRGEPDLLAAWVRHAPAWMRKQKRMVWPTPNRAPFEALGGFVLTEPQGSTFLQPFLQEGVDPITWSPGFWEQCYHRRHLTPLRRHLRTQARRGPRSAELLARLAALGDMQTLQQTSKTDWDHKLTAAWDTACTQAAWVQAQQTQPPSACMQRWIRDREAANYNPSSTSPVDVTLLTYALQQWTDEAPDLSMRIGTLDVITQGPTTVVPYELLLRTLPAHMPDTAATHAWLRTTAPFRRLPNDPFVAARLWQLPYLRQGLLSLYSRELNTMRVDRWERAAQQQNLSLDGCFAQYVANVLEEHKDWLTTDSVWGEAQWRRVMQAALQHTPPEQWLLLYFELPDFLTTSWFLQEVQHHDYVIESIGALLEKTRPSPTRDLRTRVLSAWLLQALHKHIQRV